MGRRGIKICPQCNAENGVRSSYCRGEGCEHKFSVKLKHTVPLSPAKRMDKLSSPLDDWHTLVIGDRIKIKGRSGPFWKTSDADGNVVRIPMGYHGVFVVDKLVNNGLHVYHNKDRYHAFIYMGPKMISKVTGTYLRPHKIRKMRNGVKIEGDNRKVKSLTRK